MPDPFEDMATLEHCVKCKRVVRVGLRRDILSNGATALWVACLESDPIHRVYNDRIRMGQNVSKAQAEKWGFPVGTIPLANDYSVVECCVQNCTERGFEWHHWAPKEIFGAASELWPQGKLCIKHHLEWHRRMRDYGWKQNIKHQE